MGYHFLTHSDTEVVLSAFAAWGRECLQRFNGIYAFSIWNMQKKQLFFARDRVGVKPFFYAQIGEDFVFSSEIKTLLQHPKIPAEIDTQSIAELLLVGPGRTAGYGVFCGIEELPAGWCGTFSQKDGLYLAPYWQLIDEQHTDSLEQTIETVRELVTEDRKSVV